MNFFKSTLSVVAAFAIGAASVQAQDSTVYGVISQDTADLSVLKLALDTTGLDATLDDETGNFTVFAPSDGAFAFIPTATRDSLLGDSAALSAILTYHVVPGRLTSDSLFDGRVLPTVNGDSLTVSVDDTDPANPVIKVDSATINLPNLPASNGVVHKINAVLMPSTDTTGTDSTDTSVRPIQGADISLRVFPNPTTDIATVEVPSDVRISSIEVMNQAGQVVAKEIATDRVDLSGQPVGTYYLFIETNKGLVSQTLQKAGQ